MYKRSPSTSRVLTRRYCWEFTTVAVFSPTAKPISYAILQIETTTHFKAEAYYIHLLERVLVHVVLRVLTENTIPKKKKKCITHYPIPMVSSCETINTPKSVKH